MNTIGFVISHKENEKRRALMPDELREITHPEQLLFENGYWDYFGITDKEAEKYGALFGTRECVLTQDVICDPKIGDADYLGELRNQIVFGWIHAVQNPDITDKLINSQLTAYAWEDMFASGKHVFWKNNELAGEVAVLHAFQCYGDTPYGKKIALLGNGNVAHGAFRILAQLGANVTNYTRKSESLFRQEMSQYDVIVNAILWDVHRTDHIVYKSDLKQLMRNALIIDISCDRCGGIETCKPTTINEPIYVVDGIVHYAVDHTPSLYYRAASKSISQALPIYINQLIYGIDSEVLNNAKIVERGIILDQRIIEYQKR